LNREYAAISTAVCNRAAFERGIYQAGEPTRGIEVDYFTSVLPGHE